MKKVGRIKSFSRLCNTHYFSNNFLVNFLAFFLHLPQDLLTLVAFLTSLNEEAP